MHSNTKQQPMSLMALAWIAFGGFGVDFAVNIVLSAIFPDNPAPRLIGQAAVCIIWALWARALMRYARRHHRFVYRANPLRIPVKNWVFVALIAVGLVFWGYVSWGYQFKPVVEFSAGIGALGVGAFVLQYIYYALEAALMFECIGFAQQAGELRFGSASMPWGGFFLGLTWGLMHILTKGVANGMYAFVCGILYGVVYLLVKKDMRAAYPIILLLFLF